MSDIPKGRDALAKVKAEVLDRVGMFTTSSGREAPAKDLPMVRQLVEQVVDIMIDIGEASVQDAADVRRTALQEAANIALRCANTTEDYIKDKGCRWVAREIEHVIASESGERS